MEFPKEIIGFGVITEDACVREDAPKLFYDMASDSVKELFREAYGHSEYHDDFKFFLDGYENDTYCWSGFEAALVDTINECEFCGNAVFRFEDLCIYVEPYIPENREDVRVTQEEIRKILAKYLDPLLEDPLSIGWHLITIQ